jgi:ABC-2 type transport system permease protein
VSTSTFRPVRTGPSGIGAAIGGAGRSVVRTLSFFSKWLAEVVRQPALMLSLVAGPFLLLLLFGEGVKLGAPLPKTVLVWPQGTQEQRISPVRDEVDEYLEVIAETDDLDYARGLLREGDAELVAVVPPDPLTTVQQGKHAPIYIYTNEIDPVRKSYARTYIREQIAYLNQQTLNKAIGDAQASIQDARGQIQQAREAVQLARSAQGDVDRARRQIRDLKGVVDPLASSVDQVNAAAQGASFVIPGLTRPAEEAGRLAQTVETLRRNVDQLDQRLNGSGGAASLPSDAELARIDADLAEVERLVNQATTIPSEVLSAPFALELENVAPLVPDYIDFYAPAVLALLVQHLAITLGALSMARIRLLGLMELLRTSPVRPSEVVTGNYLSYGTLCAIAAALLVALLAFALKVPVSGSWVEMLGMVGLLILCSLGIGFVVSMVSSSEQQAAQIAMLILIGSVFFSGFIVPQETLSFPVSMVSFLFPATYAIRTLQDVMLRGVLRTRIDVVDLGPVAPYMDYVILGAGAVLFFALTVWLFRREFRPD